MNIEQIKKQNETIKSLKLNSKEKACLLAKELNGLFCKNYRKYFTLIPDYENYYICYKHNIFNSKEDRKSIRKMFGSRNNWEILPTWETTKSEE